MSQIGALIFADPEWVTVIHSSRAMSGESCMPHGVTFWILATHLDESVDRCIRVHGAFYMDTILFGDNNSEPESVWVIESRVL